MTKLTRPISVKLNETDRPAEITAIDFSEDAVLVFLTTLGGKYIAFTTDELTLADKKES